MNWQLLGATAGAEVGAACRTAWAEWLAENEEEALKLGVDAARALFSLAALEALQPETLPAESAAQLAQREELLAIRSRLQLEWSVAVLAQERRAAVMLAAAQARTKALLVQIGTIGLRALVLVMAGV